MVFPGVQKSTWSYDQEAKAWYFHRFYDFQPDLNTSHPEVQAEILKIMGFWIQLGVSGFRMDAVPFVIATKGPKVGKPQEQYDMLRRFREFLQWRQGDCIVLAEANVLPETDMEYFGADGDRMHMMFNFQINQNLFYALASADARPLIKAMKATRPRPATAQWGMFLRNHDECSTWAGSANGSGRRCLRRSRRTPKCSFTSAVFAGGSLRCSMATAGGWSSPTA
jgi:maltose alpha-D-glucosyltransferase/alpha-amylase